MTAEWFLAALRHDRAVVLTSLGSVVLLAWAYLLLGAGMQKEMMDMGGGQIMAMLPEWTAGYGLLVFVMWAVMMVAMMLPSAAPVTLLVATVARKRAAAGGQLGRPIPLFVAGYLSVWFAFAAAATLAQWRLEAAELVSDTMALASLAAAGGVMIAAGIYQWTPLKQACLRRCRSPLEFLMFHFRDGAWGALASGMRHGVFCLGCCWMLMALLFVGGVMNLAWIGGIALLVLIEKALPWGGWIGRATGVVMLAWGAATLAMSV